MDAFVVEQKEAQEEQERLSYMLAKQLYLTPPIPVPILLLRSWENKVELRTHKY